MTEAEFFPLITDGETNPQLMSYAQLYLDEIVQIVLNSFSEVDIKAFLRTIGSSEIELKRDESDIEWLVYALLRHQEGFKDLYDYIKNKDPPLFDKIILKNESGLYKETVDAFKSHFLIPARDIITEGMKEKAMNIEMDFLADNDENDENMEESVDEPETNKDESLNESNSNTTIDSDDVLPEDYYEKRREQKKREKKEKEEKAAAEKKAAKAALLYGYEETVLDKIAAIFDPEFAKSTLERAYGSLKTITDPLNTPENASEMNYSPWARAILRELPRMAADKQELPDFPSLLFNFAKACENDPNNRVAILYLFANYEEELDKRKAALAGRFGRTITVDMVKEVVKECRSAEDYAVHRKAATYDYQTTVMPICLRQYQKELVEKANKGENTVIVAPTGSGKTVVAAQIMRHHVMSRKAKKKPYRMVMVVPKIPLVEQQQKQLYQYMNDVVYSSILHGDMMFEEQGKIEKVLCAELIVMTPQILINILESRRAKEKLYVADISLLILDECHHCCSNHPYAQLMKIIREWEHEKPQIVGLTASLGVGKDGTLHEASAHEHVVSLLARMTAVSVSTVVLNEKELEAHVKLPVDDIRDVRRADNHLVTLPFTDKLTEFMNSITVTIRKDLQIMSKPGNDSGVLLPQSLVKTTVNYNETEKYGGRIEAIKTSIRPMNDGAKKAELNMALDILKVCNMAWAMNDLLPTSSVWPAMKVEMNALKSRSGENKFIADFYAKYFQAFETSVNSEQQEDNDMLRALRTELSDQFKKNANSKVIIFVATRELSSALAGYINERNDIINMGAGRECAFIISSKARGVGTVSQSPVEQKAALNNFRNNKLAVLVSTTVAEEGLDVPECNLIIKYNMTGNVISLTQQRGRARAKDSRSVLIVLSGSVKKRELENANAERMMNHIVRKIHQQGDAMLKKAVENKWKEMKREEDTENEKAERKKSSLQSKKFEVLCGNCNAVLCDSYQIKNDASHYFACDKDIWSVTRIDYTDLKGKFIDMVTTVIGKVFCNNEVKDGTCGHELGKVINYYGCYLPSLKCSALALKDKTENKIIGMDLSSNKKKNWSEVSDTFFYISKINNLDVEEMVTALSQHNAELFEYLELRCKEIRKKTRRDEQRKYEKKEDEGELSDD